MIDGQAATAQAQGAAPTRCRFFRNGETRNCGIVQRAYPFSPATSSATRGVPRRHPAPQQRHDHRGGGPSTVAGQSGPGPGQCGPMRLPCPPPSPPHAHARDHGPFGARRRGRQKTPGPWETYFVPASAILSNLPCNPSLKIHILSNQRIGRKLLLQIPPEHPPPPAAAENPILRGGGHHWDAQGGTAMCMRRQHARCIVAISTSDQQCVARLDQQRTTPTIVWMGPAASTLSQHHVCLISSGFVRILSAIRLYLLQPCPWWGPIPHQNHPSSTIEGRPHLLPKPNGGVGVP